jgi:phage-related protein
VKPADQKKVHAEFFKQPLGGEPVREELMRLGRPAKTDIGGDILFVERNWRVDRPYVDLLVKKKGDYPALYEVRTKSDELEYRTLFFVYGNRMVLVHLFQKTTRKTPRSEIDLAEERMRKWVAEEKALEAKAKKGK